MKNFKTSKNNRDKYVYYSVKDPKITITDDDVTKFYIDLLHEMDDDGVDEKRRFRHKMDLDDNLDTVVVSFYNTPEDILIKREEEKEESKVLEFIMDILNEEQKQLINKKYGENLTNVEIGREENVAESTIRWRINAIFKKIRKKLKNNCDY